MLNLVFSLLQEIKELIWKNGMPTKLKIEATESSRFLKSSAKTAKTSFSTSWQTEKFAEIVYLDILLSHKRYQILLWGKGHYGLLWQKLAPKRNYFDFWRGIFSHPTCWSILSVIPWSFVGFCPKVAIILRFSKKLITMG